MAAPQVHRGIPRARDHAVAGCEAGLEAQGQAPAELIATPAEPVAVVTPAPVKKATAPRAPRAKKTKK